MDLDDLDLDSDRISDFLRSKLEEVKSTNFQLEESLKFRHEVAGNYQNEITKEQLCHQVQIVDVFKKLCYNKFVLGVELRNESESDLENANVILDWDSLSPLNYKYHLISSKNSELLTEGLKWTNRLERFGKILIVFDSPLFSDQLNYTITGSINFHQNQKKIALNLPLTHLTADDITNNDIAVRVCEMIDGNFDDLLACALSCKRHEFVIVISGNNRTQLLEVKLEVDCSFRKLNLTSNKKYFMAHNICPSLEMALLEVEIDQLADVAYLNTYCRDRNILISLLHYLHKHITGVAIIPVSSYRPDLNLVDSSELIKKALLKEINCLEEFSGGDLTVLRNKMVDLEHETDILMARINEEGK